MSCWGNGGPGRARSQSADGMVKMAQQRPTRKRMRRSGRVGESLSLRNLVRTRRRRMLRSWTDTAAT